MKLTSTSSDPYSGNICIRRASAEDNFATWEDIKIVTLREQDINDYPIIYDYTIQSGIWYKYGVQSLSTLGERGKLIEIQNPIQRLFNHSFILGLEDQQLTLQFDAVINSFKYQIYDGKQDPIGSVYPYISRNAATHYRTFPITGLISMWMDENQIFLKNGKKDIYKFSSIVNEYEEYNINRGIMQYDYTYVRNLEPLV